ncbi:MAG: hypothetical protein A3D87_02655 [Omnitrophica WOR_2 bacterium RIFCSPHIGHO2_02_FULL_50_17]|nr:MAG: hypothetical protein A3D87_02655 [Omnitrophica WOR_2 bacterium RIFCSPHIGHO2_02_FULL_50_17]
MSFGRFFKLTVVVTSLALVYIHLQMQIIDLAYQGEAKDRQVKEFVEKNDHAFYAISKLKSANHIGGVLLAKNSDMQFAGPGDIVQVAMPGDFTDESLSYQAQPKRKTNLLLSLLSFTTPAEAGHPR